MNRRELLAAAISMPLTLSFAQRALAGGSGGTPTILVTADLESHVVALDVATRRVVRRIRTLPGPRSIESAFMTWGLVAHTALGRLTIVDAPTLRVRRVISGFGAPRYTAVLPRMLDNWSVVAYVTDSSRREVATIEVRSGRILSRTAVPGPARHISVDRSGETLWTALGTKAERIAVLDLDDPRRPRLRRTFETPFLAHDVVFSPRGEHVWVTSGDERRVAVYEPRSRKPVAMLEAGAAPQHLAFRGGTAYVASGVEGALSKIAHNGVLLNESVVPPGSYNVTLGRDGPITPSLDRGTVTLADFDGEVSYVRQLARAAHDACLVVA